MRSCEQIAALETNRGKQSPANRGTSSEAMNEGVETGLSEFPSSQGSHWGKPLLFYWRLYQAPGASPVVQ